jgi:hypothetical protein
LAVKQTSIAAAIGCATLLTVALPAQDNAPPTPSGNMDITGIPPARGIYYRAANQWVVLSPQVLMPFWEGRAEALEILNVGSDHAIAEIPGSHSGVQIGNDARPTFYLHGISPADVYLVRAATKADYRELWMPVSRHFREWAHFRAKDVTPVEIQAMNGDIVAIRPSADLKPGEYALASVFEPGERWIRLGFDFGIVGNIPRQ